MAKQVALTPDRIALLQQLAMRPLTVIDLKEDKQIRLVQRLAREGYAIDFGDQKGRRVEVRLRIWGITSAGKAILEQMAMVEAVARQPSLIPVAPKEPIKPISGSEGLWDGKKWFQGTDGTFTARKPRKLAPRDGIEKEDGK
jgi:hypothetical protein